MIASSSASPTSDSGRRSPPIAATDGTVLDEADVIAHVKTQLARYKAPKRVVFVAEVPRAPNGKADYNARQAAHSTPSTPAPPA